MHRAVAGAVAAFAVFVGGCRSDILKEDALVKPGYGAPVAHVKMVDGFDCRDRASVVTLPKHCAWPVSAAHAPILSVDVQLVSRIDAAGKVDAVRILSAPAGNEFDAAAIACAKRAEYRAAVDASGVGVASETCPVTLRLARYPTDLEPHDRERTCPPTLTTLTLSGYGAAAHDQFNIRCP
ncbi:MAG: hypothetical protein KF819_29170 [Labilithrix sp.]|nr:hypothetical protein [Labilithrix sp.]